MRLLIITTDPTLLKWKSLPNKLAACDAAIAKGKNADFGHIEVLYFHTKPLVIGGKIDREWLETLKAPYFRAGYDIIGLHSSENQWKVWEIKPTLRGANPNSSNELEALYFSADETSRRHNFNRFVQVFLHELAHGYYDHSGQLDLVHAWHEANADITGLFGNFDWSLYQPERMALKKKLATTQFSVLSYVQTILTGMFEERRQQSRFQPLVGRTAQELVSRMKAAGFPIRVTSTYRSSEEQAMLYAQGRTMPGNIVTNAKAGESFHNYGVAFDVVFREQGYEASDAMWKNLGSVGKALGLEWGGDWKNPDRPHFSQKLGYTLKDFQTGKVDYSKFK